MKKVILWAGVLAVLIAAGSYYAFSKAPQDLDKEKLVSGIDARVIPGTLDSFYQKYESCLKNPPDEAMGRVSEYCQNNTGLTTAAFAGNLEEGGAAIAGADSVVCSQSLPESMKASSDFQVKNNKATGFMEEKFGPNGIKVQVNLVKDGGVWKVDNVVCPKS